MVVTRIRQAGSLKLSVRVGELWVGQAETHLQSERWSLQQILYISGVNLWCLTAPLATLLEVSYPDPKITPHTLYKVCPDHFPGTSGTPFFWVFTPFFKDF